MRVVDDDVCCNFHAYNFDPQTDSRGNFYFAQSGQYTDRPRPGGVIRVPPGGGCPVRLIEDVQVTPVGIDVSFSFPLDAASARTATAWKAEMCDYLWSNRDGSDAFSVLRPGTKGHDRLNIAAVALDAERRKTRLTIPQLAICDQLLLEMDEVDAEGRPFSEQVYLAIHAVPTSAASP